MLLKDHLSSPISLDKNNFDKDLRLVYTRVCADYPSVVSSEIDFDFDEAQKILSTFKFYDSLYILGLLHFRLSIYNNSLTDLNEYLAIDIAQTFDAAEMSRNVITIAAIYSFITAAQTPTVDEKARYLISILETSIFGSSDELRKISFRSMSQLIEGSALSSSDKYLIMKNLVRLSKNVSVPTKELKHLMKILAHSLREEDELIMDSLCDICALPSNLKSKYLLISAIIIKHENFKFIFDTCKIFIINSFHLLVDQWAGCYFSDVVITFLTRYSDHLGLKPSTKSKRNIEATQILIIHKFIDVFFEPLQEIIYNISDNNLTRLENNFFHFIFSILPQAIPILVDKILSHYSNTCSEYDDIIMCLTIRGGIGLYFDDTMIRNVLLGDQINAWLHSKFSTVRIATFRIILDLTFYNMKEYRNKQEELLICAIQSLENLQREDKYLVVKLLKPFLRTRSSNSLAKNLADFALSKLDLVQSPSNEMALQIIHLVSTTSSKNDLSTILSFEIMRKCVELMESRSSLERTLAYEICSQVNNILDFKEILNSDLLIEKIAKTTRFSYADGAINLLSIIVSDGKNLCNLFTEILKRQTQNVSFYSCPIEDYDIFLRNPIFPSAIALIRFTVTFDKDLLNEAYKASEICFDRFQELYEIKDDEEETSYSEDEKEDNTNCFESGTEWISVQRILWHSIKYLNLLVLHLLKLQDDEDSLVRFLEEICRYLSLLRHWGAVNALADIHQELLMIIAKKRPELLQVRLENTLKGLIAQKDICLVRIDGKHAGVAVPLLHLLMMQSFENSRSNLAMNHVFKVLIETMTRGSEGQILNAIGILQYMWQNAKISAMISDVMSVAVFECCMKFMRFERSAPIKSAAMNLYIAVICKLLCMNNSQETSKTVLDTFSCRRDLKALIFKLSGNVKSDDENVSFPLVLFLSRLKPLLGQECTVQESDELSTLKKYLWNLLGSINWHVRVLAAKSLRNILVRKELKLFIIDVMDDILNVSLSNNQIHGHVVFLSHLLIAADKDLLKKYVVNAIPKIFANAKLPPLVYNQLLNTIHIVPVLNNDENIQVSIAAYRQAHKCPI